MQQCASVWLSSVPPSLDFSPHAACRNGVDPCAPRQALQRCAAFRPLQAMQKCASFRPLQAVRKMLSQGTAWMWYEVACQAGQLM